MRAAACKVHHFVYVSVAHPAPLMKTYVQARTDVEEHMRRRGLHATVLRRWYVLGPGRRWPVLLKPFYALLVSTVENPAEEIRVVEVPEIARALLS